MMHAAHRRNWTIALAFIVLIPCLVGIWYVDHLRGNDLRRVQAEEAWASYDAAFGSCVRGNVLRSAVNDLATATRSVSFVIGAFLDSSIDLRLNAGRPGLADQARQARDAVARIADRIKPIEQVDCTKAVRRPSVPRPFP